MKYLFPGHPSQPIYRLSPDTLIGRGNKRDCHSHPSDSSMCIKVAKDPTKWEKCHEQSIVEWYYTKHLKKSRVPFDYLADCYGWVQTNYGLGLVIERIRDDDGSSALTLHESLTKNLVTADDAYAMLEELKHWALTYAVAVADLNSTNLMVRRRESKTNLVFVDGIGSRKPELKFTLYQRLPWLARMKTKSQWKRQGEPLFKLIKGLADGTITHP